MRRVIVTRHLMGGLIVGALAAAAAVAAEPEAAPPTETVRLAVARPQALPAWHHVLPTGRAAVEAPSVWSARVGKQTVLLLDVDGNGRVDDVGVDAWWLPRVGEAHAVPFEGDLVLGAEAFGTVHDPEAKTLALTPRPVSPDRIACRAVALLNRLRMAHGLSPVRLDDELSADMALHLRYMLVHGLTHDEDPAAKRYTEAGARAGKNSVLTSLRYGEAAEEVQGWWRTFYHRTYPAHPDLRRIGFAHNGSYAGLEVLTGRETRAWQYPVCVPAPDTTAVSGAFNEGGERPPPYPDGQAPVGFPITVYLGFQASAPTDVQAELRLKGPKGKPVPFWLSWHGQPANEARPDNNDTITLVPEAPLKPSRAHWVRVRYTLDGQAHDLTWTFSTPKPERRTRRR